MEIFDQTANTRRNKLDTKINALVKCQLELKIYFCIRFLLLSRNKEIAAKHETVFREILIEDGVPLPSSWDSTMSQSIDPPFSDKLMMFHTSSITAISVAGYGAAMGASLRKDLGGHYTRLVAEILQYANDGVKLMIKNSWLEQPPQNVDREALRNRSV